MYQYKVVGTYSVSEGQRLQFSATVYANSGEEAIEVAKKYYYEAEVTEVHYMGEKK